MIHTDLCYQNTWSAHLHSLKPWHSDTKSPHPHPTTRAEHFASVQKQEHQNCWLSIFASRSGLVCFWRVLVLEGLIGLHRTVQVQLLQHYWLGHRLGLLWYWMVCLWNEQRSFCHFWDCIQVLYFRLSCDHDAYSISSKGFLPTVVDIMVIWVKFTHSSPFWFTDF